MEKVVAVRNEESDVDLSGLHVVGFGSDWLTLDRRERGHDRKVLDGDEGNHHISVVGEQLVSLKFIGPSHDGSAGGIALDHGFIICTLVMLPDIQEIGEQLVGHDIVLVCRAPALCPVQSHMGPGESHVLAGSVPPVCQQPVDAFEVVLELAAQILDDRESIFLDLLVQVRGDDQAVGLAGNGGSSLDSGLDKVIVINDDTLDVLAVSLDNGLECGIGNLSVQFDVFLGNIVKYSGEPEISHLGLGPEVSGHPSAVIILAAAVLDIEFL